MYNLFVLMCSTLARNILALVKCHPMVIVLNQAEIVDFVMLYQNYTATGDFYNNLVSWPVLSGYVCL